MNYVDKFGRWHDKPCRKEEPSSNNGWIYTAVARKLNIKLETTKIQYCFYQCFMENKILRSPGKEDPPISRDEILGMIYLKLMSCEDLKKRGWSFSPYIIPKFNLIQSIKAFMRLKGKHRNAVWENGGEPHAWRFAFSVPLHDRAWILRYCGRCVPVHLLIYEYFSKLVRSGDRSSNLIYWIKYSNKVDLKVIQDYLGIDHPFTQIAMKENRHEVPGI